MYIRKVNIITIGKYFTILFLFLFSFFTFQKAYAATCWCDGSAKVCEVCYPGGSPQCGGLYVEKCCHEEVHPNSRDCAECKPIKSCSCSTGYTSTYTTFGYKAVSCNDGCDGTAYSACYCTSACTPEVTDCSSVGMSNTYIDGGGSKEFKCKNACNNETVKTCYCYPCILSCPNPLSASVTLSNPNLILQDFITCSNGCDTPQIGSCWERNSGQPIESISVFYVDEINRYAFRSFTHTGLSTPEATLNNSIEMVTEYEDFDGYTQIQAVGVWFRAEKYSGKPGTPIWFTGTQPPQAPSNDSWGFLMVKEVNGWKAYVPSYASSTPTWVRAVETSATPTLKFMIPGPGRQNMVEIELISPPYDNSYGKIYMRYKMKFTGNNITENVAETKYNIMLLGLDKFSFVPYNYYSEYFNTTNLSKLEGYWPKNRMRYADDSTPLLQVPYQNYARDWSDTNRDWTVDFQKPSITNTSITPIEQNQLEIKWTVTDIGHLYSNLHSIVGSIYSNMNANAKQIEIKSIYSSKGNINTPTAIGNPFSPKNITEQTPLTLDNYHFKIEELDTDTTIITLIVDVGENKEGVLRFDLRAFDDAGNMDFNQEATINLYDWFITKGGLAYSSGGTDFSVKSPQNEGDWSWSTLSFDPYSNPLSGIELTSDLSSEMWSGDGDSLEKGGLVKAYTLDAHKGHGKTNFYETLINVYDQRKDRISGISETEIETEEISGTSLSNHFQSDCFNDYCVIKVDQLEIDEGVTCDKKALFFVSGNLIIQTPVFSDNVNKSSCIFVVQGSVDIYIGDNDNTFEYDLLEGYILADGNITIHKQTNGEDNTKDGLFVLGGLQSISKERSSSILIEQSLLMKDRLTHPVLVIENHPKYGELASKIFGSQLNIQKVEVGFKPG